MSFLGEIKRRKMFQVAAVYAVVAWLLIQIVATVEAPLNLPAWFDTAVIVLLAIGFPITLIMSWGFNLTPGGLVREGGVATRAMPRRGIEYVLIGLIVIALFWLVYRVEFSGRETAADYSGPTQSMAAEVTTETPSTVIPNSIAVLPFENLSPDPDNAYFAAGIHESTLNQLAKIRDLVVLSRSTVMQYAGNRLPIPEIAKALKVETVMEGSVRYADGRVLITAQLIDGATDAHLWSQEFNFRLRDVFAVQAEVARQIANAMQVRLLADEIARIARRTTESTEAYQHYLHALSIGDVNFSPEYGPQKIESLRQAIAADPNYADAYAEFAITAYNLRDREIAPDYAEKAIELDPTLGLAYVVLGLSYGNYYDRQEEAHDAFLQARDFSPNDAVSLSVAALNLGWRSGNYTEAIRLGRRAESIAPESALVKNFLGRIYLGAGNAGAAADAFEAASHLDPTVYENYLNLANAKYLAGEHDGARANLDRAVEVMGSRATYRVDYVAYLYGLLGETKMADQLLGRFDAVIGGVEGDSRQFLTWGVLGTRDKDRALRAWSTTIMDYLDNGLPVSPYRLGRFRDNWLNDPMLEEPEFLELRRRLGFAG